MDSKNILQSKTFWVNIIAVLAMLAQTQTGFIIEPEAQAAILSVINIILRFVTKSPVVWGSDSNSSSGSSGLNSLGACLLAVMLLVSCTSLNSNVYKYTEATKVTAEGIARIAINMHKAGTLDDKNYLKVKDTYERARKASDAAIFAMQAALEVGQDPRSSENYNLALDESVKLFTKLIDLAVDLKLIQGGGQ
ncbi:MAG: hypothetical protein C4560_03045 [Nitrospiraceae bacterium]|nr:MAG: hypothetical protein C4560_03045 [Nitrospiraceae bacterium]